MSQGFASAKLLDIGGVPEVNDLTAAVVWANVPDANVTESSVTQHVAAIDHDALLNFTATEHFTQAAISIPLSQINDVTALAAEVNLLDLSGLTVGWVLSADSATTASWKAATGGGGSIGGSITDNQIAVGATTANDIEGTSGFTFDSATNLLKIDGNVTRFDNNYSSGALDQKYWRYAWSESHIGVIFDDALANSYEWMRVERSGTGAGVQVDTIDFTSETDITLNSNILEFKTNGTTLALTLDASQDAIFEGNIVLQNGSEGIYFDNLAGTPGLALFRFTDNHIYLDNNEASGFLVLRTGGSVTALTLNSSQNATFAGAVTSAGPDTIGPTTNDAPLTLNSSDSSAYMIIADDTAVTPTSISIGSVNGDLRLQSGGTGVGSFGTLALIISGSTQAATFSGDVTVQGAFTSLGIDDNATGEVFNLTNQTILWGDTSSAETWTQALQTTNDGIHILSGGNAAAQGGAIQLYGPSHATLPGDVLLRSSAQTFLAWDESQGVMRFYTDTGVKTTALTLDASQNATFAGTVDISGTDVTITNATTPQFLAVDTTNSLQTKLQSADNQGIVGTVSNHVFLIRTNNTNAITLDTSQNATFAGDVTVETGGRLVTGDAAATSGASVIEGTYSGTSRLFVAGSTRSSGRTYLARAVRADSVTADGYESSADNVAFARGAFEVGGASFHWRGAASATVAIGTDVAMTEYMNLAPGLLIVDPARLDPATAIRIDGNAAGSPILDLRQNGAQRAYFEYSTINGLRIDSDADIELRSNNTLGLTISSTGQHATFAGDVTVDNAAPIIDLTADAANTAMIRLAGNAQVLGSASFDIQQDGVGDVYLWQRSNDRMLFGTNGTLAFTIETNQTLTTIGAIDLGTGLRMSERADHVYTPVATYGELWLKSGATQALMFTDDLGTDYDLTAAGGGGIGGSITNDQIAVGAATADDIEGSADFTFTTALFHVNSTNIDLDGVVNINDELSGQGIFNINSQTATSPIMQFKINNAVDAFIQKTVNSDLIIDSDDNITLYASNTEIMKLSSTSVEIGGGAGSPTLNINGTSLGNPQINFQQAGSQMAYIAYDDGNNWFEIYADRPVVLGPQNNITATFWGATNPGMELALGGIRMKERSDHSWTPAATWGEIWLANNTANRPIFTDDASIDHEMVATYEASDVDITGAISAQETPVPDTVTKITILFRDFSVSTTANVWIILGDAGGYETTGYTGATSSDGGTTRVHSGGFYLMSAASAGASVFQGRVVLQRMGPSSNVWVMDSHMASTGANNIGAGSKSLTATLDRIKVELSTGTIDGSSKWSVIYE